MHYKREQKFDWHDGGAILTKDVLIKHKKKKTSLPIYPIILQKAKEGVRCHNFKVCYAA